MSSRSSKHETRPKNTNTASEVAPFLQNQHTRPPVHTSASTHWTLGVLPPPCSLLEALANHNIKRCRYATRTDLILFPTTLPLGSSFGSDVAWQARSAHTCFGTLDTPRTGSHQGHGSEENLYEPSKARGLVSLLPARISFLFFAKNAPCHASFITRGLASLGEES